MIVRIKNLRCRTIIGIYDWEYEFDGAKAAETDDICDTVDYKALKREIVEQVESSRFYLLEKLASRALEVVMSDEKVTGATVEVDKPHALRLAESVSVVCSAGR